MSWMRYRLRTTVEAEDILSDLLLEQGVEGVEIENSLPLTPEEQKGMFVDIPPVPKGEEGVSHLIFYLEEGPKARKILERVRREIEALREGLDMGPCTLEVSETREEDWVNNWKQYFHTFQVGDFCIVPTWEEVPLEAEGKRLLRMDPGTAFGTGKHETTQLCIRALTRRIGPAMEVLDVGCGSGILGLVTLKLGAFHVVGTDLDEQAVLSTRENMARNGISPAAYQVCIGNLIDQEEVRQAVGTRHYDLVVANILAEVLLPMTPAVAPYLKSGGFYITSGILSQKVPLVRQVVEEAGMKVLSVEYQGEWACITARKE